MVIQRNKTRWGFWARVQKLERGQTDHQPFASPPRTGWGAKKTDSCLSSKKKKLGPRFGFRGKLNEKERQSRPSGNRTERNTMLNETVVRKGQGRPTKRLPQSGFKTKGGGKKRM